MNKRLVSIVGLGLMLTAAIGCSSGLAANDSDKQTEGIGGDLAALAGCAVEEGEVLNVAAGADCDDTPVLGDDNPGGLYEDDEPKGDSGSVPQPISATPAPPEGNGSGPEPLPMCVELDPDCDDFLDAIDEDLEDLYEGDEHEGGGGAVPLPVTGMIAPDLRLTFEGGAYTGVEIFGSTSVEGEINAVVCCGTPVDPAEMVVVGTATQHNPDGDATVEVYRGEYGGTTDDLYTYSPAQSFVEDGELNESGTTPATWIRWAAN
ncbi:MAG: hypothetical protein C1O27_001570 [Chloroflexi bacterium]|jgi:hypothetical protein|nr:MAG: hypothetical protein C1O27_001570 [Chloroflexota bacterium]